MFGYAGGQVYCCGNAAAEQRAGTRASSGGVNVGTCPILPISPVLPCLARNGGFVLRLLFASSL
jgi:hypothetical protein